MTGPTLQNTVPITGNCWIFTHLQKSRGTTVKWILRQAYRDKFVDYDSIQWKSGDVFLNIVRKQLADGTKKVIAGGYPQALRRSSAIDHKCRWCTIFRHPISRMVSAYYYCKETPRDIACASDVVKARDVDLISFAKHWGNFAMRQFVLGLVTVNDVTRYSQTAAARAHLPAEVKNIPKISGWYLVKMYLDGRARTSENTEIPEEVMYEMLKPVQDLIRDRYTVGILEEFNTTLSLRDAALDIPKVDWHSEYGSKGKRNVDTKYKEMEASSLAKAWTNSDIKKYMQLDLVLYEHAVDVFHEQARAYDLE